MDRRTRSETQQNGAKAAGSVTKLASPKKVKRKKSEVETETESEKKTKKEEEEAEAEDSTKRKIVIEHCKQCNAFKTRAIQVKEGLEGAVPGVTVTLNPEKEMKRPFAPMKALDMEEVIEDIINKIK
ncbi:hypothetical protein HID58_029872 [Brassica napus]|uniref:Selenoprotein H n=1 Tax=Brassica napus TaxID=3708 RepID=A0ABQ8CGJ0_BRANA|nr:hypothetical protein HID58_029872 [Brassica napus]